MRSYSRRGVSGTGDSYQLGWAMVRGAGYCVPDDALALRPCTAKLPRSATATIVAIHSIPLWRSDQGHRRDPDPVEPVRTDARFEIGTPPHYSWSDKNCRSRP